MSTKRDSLMDWQDNRRMFDQIAPRYDLINRLMSFGIDRYWRKRAIKALLSDHSAGHILDIGCGTGDISLQILRHNEGANVTGIDISEEMLKLAITKADREELASRSVFQVGDATALAFKSQCFDGIICAFCFRNIAYRAKALGEMKRVLHPGGRLVILELTVPTTGLMRVMHRLYTRWFIPLIGRCLSMGSAYQYLVRSINHFPRPAQVQQTIREAGFEQVACIPLTGGVVCLFVATTPAGVSS